MLDSVLSKEITGKVGEQWCGGASVQNTEQPCMSSGVLSAWMMGCHGQPTPPDDIPAGHWPHGKPLVGSCQEEKLLLAGFQKEIPSYIQ